MSNDYVLLVSTPRVEMLKKGEDGFPPVGDFGEMDINIPAVAAALSLFDDLSAPAPANSNNGTVKLEAAGSTEGGNGSGGDGFSGGPLLARQSFHGKSYWNFRVCPQNNQDDDVRFPPILRFEACIYFSHLKAAREFLAATDVHGQSNKQKLDAVFKFALLVAITSHN